MTEQTSLHTKYRPTKFSEVIGHKEVVKSLKNIVKDKRQHSFIFTGPAGIGKTTMARILANAFCDNKGTSANIIEIPAAKYTGVDNMRGITDKSVYKAIGESPVKAFIVDEAHRLSASAWDSILKEIEEPAAHVFWMFATTNASKIPNTIVTRCVQYDLTPLSEDEITEILVKVSTAEELEIEDDVIEAIAENSGGSARQALVYLEACAYAEDASEARKIMKKAGETKEVVDLCRLLLARRRSWQEAIKIVNDLKVSQEAESIRIVICNYLAAVLLNTKKEKDAFRILQILSYFETPYNTSDKMAPLLLSIGGVLFDGE